MHRSGRLVEVAFIAALLAGCSSGSPTATPTTKPPVATSSLGSTGSTAGADTTGRGGPTSAPGAVLAGQPGATTRAALGSQPGYQETAVEAVGHQFVHRYRPTLDTPGTQVHCPAVAVSVGSTFVCQVDSGTGYVDEPLKADGVNPLNLEFAIIDPTSFVCSAHAAWVVQAMAKAGVACTSSPTTGGQGQGQGQGGQ